jgi:nitrogen PTS system EIIA component
MKVIDILHHDMIVTDLASSGKPDVLSELGVLLARQCSMMTADEITKVLVERERLATTGVGDGVAIPHGKVSGIPGILAAVGISRTGIAFDAVDNLPVHIFFALLAPPDAGGDHLRALAGISRLLKEPEIRDRLMAAREPEEILEIVRED